MRFKSLWFRLQRPDDGDGSELAGGDAVGSGNDARVAMLERINDLNDGLRAEELMDVNDDDSTSPYQPNTLIPTDDDGVTERELQRMEAETSDDAGPEPEAAPRMITRKVNGRDVTRSEDDWFAIASKVEAADTYLEEAARLRREALQQNQPPAQNVPSPEDVRAAQVEDRRALVRAIQMGTEEEAMAALEQLQSMNSRPELTSAQLAKAVDDRLTFKEAVSKFESEFSDILSDPQLRTLALQRDQELMAAGDKREYWDRYSEIGNSLRGWRDGLIKSATKDSPAPPDPLALKQAAKADAAKRSTPQGAARKAPASAQPDDREESVSDVIANIAKARGGPQWARA